MKVKVSVSLGEIVDKISILRIKTNKIIDEEKIKYIKEELRELENSLKNLSLDDIKVNSFLKELEYINSELWGIEDRIREKESCKEFDAEFIELARKVYLTNDKRFLIKNSCNETFGSQLKEVKSYKKYD